ncbi:MAG: Hpt domain-containing protein [Phycisphaerales bacterium]|nr:MAG: Hpt domain-containing protein [Phycisphaerales bacterium]
MEASAVNEPGPVSDYRKRAICSVGQALSYRPWGCLTPVTSVYRRRSRGLSVSHRPVPHLTCPMPAVGDKSRPGPADDSCMGESSPIPGKVSPEPLKSEFAGDADMMELVEFFVSDLREKIEAIIEAWKAGDGQRLRRLAHQLKGAGGGYGFPTITEAAGDLEHHLMDDEAGLSALGEKVEALILLCRRASAEE